MIGEVGCEKMFNSDKIEALFSALLMLGKYSDFKTFVFNEDLKDIANIHGKHWEFQNQTVLNYKNDSVTVGVSYS